MIQGQIGEVGFRLTWSSSKPSTMLAIVLTSVGVVRLGSTRSI